MFLLLLSSTYVVSRPFLFLILSLQQVGWGGCRKLGGDTAGAGDPNRPKGYSVPYKVVPIKKPGEGGRDGIGSDGIFLPR